MKKFEGFGTMALAMAAAGLGLPPVAAAVVAAGMLKFLLIDRNGWKIIVKDLGNGMYCQHRSENYPCRLDEPYITVLEVIYADSWHEISMTHRRKQSAIKDDGDAGWLDREGNFYPCYFGGHSDVADYVLYRHYSELEDAGWVHVDNPPQKGSYTFRYVGGERTVGGMSPQQVAWLMNRGHDMNPGGREDEALRLGEYTISVAADADAFEREMRKAGLNPDDFRKQSPSKSRLAAFR